jgi:hypothetical protein
VLAIPIVLAARLLSVAVPLTLMQGLGRRHDNAIGIMT